MGSKCGPSIANIFVYIFEKSFTNIYKDEVLIYKRFIDDIFVILKNDFDKNNLINSFGELKSNIVNGLTVYS